MGVNSLPKTVTRQRRDCNLNRALLRLSPARQPLGYRATHMICDKQLNQMSTANRSKNVTAVHARTTHARTHRQTDTSKT